MSNMRPTPLRDTPPNRRNGAVPKLQCRGYGSRPIYFSSITAALFAATSGASTESEERVDQAQEPANLMEGRRRDDPCSYDRHRRRDEPEH